MPGFRGLPRPRAQPPAVPGGAVIDAAPRPDGGLAVSVTFPPVGPELPSSVDATRPTSAADRGLTMSR